MVTIMIREGQKKKIFLRTRIMDYHEKLLEAYLAPWDYPQNFNSIEAL